MDPAGHGIPDNEKLRAAIRDAKLVLGEDYRTDVYCGSNEVVMLTDLASERLVPKKRKKPPCTGGFL